MNNVNLIEGNLTLSDEKVAIILSRFNDFIGEKLLGGAIDTLSRHGLDQKNITVLKVPGSFEIPGTVAKLVDSKKYDGIICLGAVIRGATPHFDYVSAEVTKGIGALSMKSGIPIIFGILTTDTIEQAIERAGTKSGNKGADAGLALTEMINLYKKIS